MKNLLIPIILLIASCNSETNKKAELPVGNNISQINLPGCYEMSISKDTARMKINIDGNQVSGDLEYKRFEKDSNKGTFSGTFTEGIIDGWYNFQSEGLISVRQVIFKSEGEALLEGYGDVEQKGDTVYFKYPQTLKYEDDHPFKKITCN